MIVISHRGNLLGPNHRTENRLSQVESALAAGFGLETDIRRTENGTLYISHDPAEVTSGNLADAHAALWAQYPDCEIALNVKELGYETQLTEFIQQHGLTEQVFLFDFELLEDQPGATSQTIHQLDSEIRLAARVSDRNNETMEQAASVASASIIWLDEFDSLWVTRGDVQKLKEQRRTIYAISPEIHGFTMADAETRWKQFLDWGVDGICTDFPVRAKEVLVSWQ